MPRSADGPAVRSPEARPGAAVTPAFRRPLLVPVVPSLLLLVLGAVQLSRHLALWYDEDYTLLAVQTPLPRLLAAVWRSSPLVSWLTVAPSFNAPWYVLMHGWCAVFGTSVWALRLPALLCSAAAVGVLTSTVRRLGGAVAGLVAGLLAATGPLLAQQAVEARSYGAAELGVSLTVLALVSGQRRRRLFAAACLAGLMHWFTLPVLAGLGLWCVLRRRWRDAAVLAAATVPAVLLVAVQLHGQGDGTPVTEHVGLALAWHALGDWSQGAWWLSTTLVVLYGLALVRSPHRSLLACWLVVPLLTGTALEFFQPSYFGRYYLYALLSLAAGAALGVAELRRAWRPVVAAALVAVSLITCVPRLQSTSREHPDQVVALLEAQQQAGQPVAAADGRAALELAEEVAVEESRLATDLLLRPAHVPVDGTATVTWVVRSGSGSAVPSSPDDAYLSEGGWHLHRTVVVSGAYGDLTVQQWVR